MGKDFTAKDKLHTIRKQVTKSLMIEVPSDFDWKAYLALNPDVQKQGFTTEKLVLQHYDKWGRYENRKYVEERVVNNPAIITYRNKPLKDLRIVYIVACYFGERRAKYKFDDKFLFIREHLENISEISDDHITKIVLSINLTDFNEKDEIEKEIRSIDCRIPVDVMFNENKGFSYGAWHKAIIKNINEPVDYFFLIEDDYVPITKFSDIFLSKFIDDKIFFVCQKKSSDYESKVYANYKNIPIFHWASVSNGLIRADLCRKQFKEKGKVFHLIDCHTYTDGETNQMRFTKYFIDDKYEMDDVSDITQIEFFDANKGLIYLGNNDFDIIIKPIN